MSPDPGMTHLDDQLDAYSRARARRLASFYRGLREGGTPALLASAILLCEVVAWHWPAAGHDRA